MSRHCPIKLVGSDNHVLTSLSLEPTGTNQSEPVGANDRAVIGDKLVGSDHVIPVLTSLNKEITGENQSKPVCVDCKRFVPVTKY